MTVLSFARKVAIMLFLILCLSCNRKNTNVEPCPSWFDHYTAFEMKDYQQYFNRELQTLAPDFVFCGDEVIQFYRSFDGFPLWTRNGLQEHKIDTLSYFISDVYKHGLPESLFGMKHVDSLVHLLKNNEIDNQADILYATLFNLEIDLTAVYLNYGRVLNYGATDPKVVNGSKWMFPTYYADSAFAADMLHHWHQLTATLENLQPKDSAYLALQKELLRLYPLRDSILDNLSQNLLFVTEDNVVVQLCERLQLLGALDPDYVPSRILNDTVMAAVNTFRVNNAIPENRSIDQETLDKLNRPVSYYIDKLSANMERLRWKTEPQKNENYIVVNIPDFTLDTYCQGEKVFTTDICCGKTENPEKNPEERYKGTLVLPFKSETPQLYSTISRIVLNPEWNIPYSILRDEYYPKLVKSNTAVIDKEKLYVVNLKTKKKVIPDSIYWRKINRKNIPYKLVQTSGKHNALGSIKFDFPNTESVYLHDTNNKGAFKRRMRALSHGCIRVRNPFELAAVLYEMNEFDSVKCEQLAILVGNEPVTEEGEEYLEKLQEKEQKYYENLSLEQKQFYRPLRPTSIYLEKVMPVFIEYFTTFVGENGMIQYREDIYHRDENIIHIINNE